MVYDLGMPRAPLAPRILGQTFLRKVYAVFDPWKPAVWLADRRSVKVQEMQKALFRVEDTLW